MTSLTFTGSLEYIPYTIERYEEKGYELVRYRIIKNRKFGELIEVTMELHTIVVKGSDLWTAIERFKASARVSPREPKTLQERLEQAIEREDYELAAILRDKIKEL
jgi:hypothetical protein